jgi:hypothetical protein
VHGATVFRPVLSKFLSVAKNFNRNKDFKKYYCVLFPTFIELCKTADSRKSEGELGEVRLYEFRMFCAGIYKLHPNQLRTSSVLYDPKQKVATVLRVLNYIYVYACWFREDLVFRFLAMGARSSSCLLTRPLSEMSGSQRCATDTRFARCDSIVMYFCVKIIIMLCSSLC